MNDEHENGIDATAEVLSTIIKRADEGSPLDKRRLLEIFCAMVGSKKNPYPELLAYLSRTIAKALDSPKQDPRGLGRALLGGPAHRPANQATEFAHEAVAWRVAELMSEGVRREDAVSQTAEEFQELQLDDAAILKAYKQHSKQKEFKSRRELLVLAKGEAHKPIAKKRGP